VVAIVYVLAAALGISPAISFLGPGVRHEGVFISLALVGIAFAASVLDGASLDLILTAVILGSIGPSIYAIAETLVAVTGATLGDLIPRSGSSLGNPILFGGYLVPVVPLTFARAMSRGGSRTRAVYGTILTLQLAAVALARARGAWLAIAVAAVVIGIGRFGLATPKRRLTALAVLLAVGIAGALPFATRRGALVGGQTVQVRVLIWQGVTRLIGTHPGRLALGYGSEMLPAVIGPYYLPELARLEGAFSIPDRSHNDLLDAVVTTGVCGAAAILGVHVLLWLRLFAIIAPSIAGAPRWTLALGPIGGAALAAVLAVTWLSRIWLPLAVAGGVVTGAIAMLAWIRSTPGDEEWSSARWLALGLLGGSIAHFVEIQTGVATMTSRLIWWAYVGVVAARAWPVNEHGQDDVARDSGIRATTLAGAAAVAVLVFDFHQPGAGWSVAASTAIAVTAAVIVMLVTSGHAATSGRAAATLTIVAGTMAAALAGWDMRTASFAAAASGIPQLLAWASWQSHDATMCLAFLTAVALAIACSVDQPHPSGRRHAWIFMVAIGGVALIAIIFGARPARADVLARLAQGIEGDGQRWTEADALQEARVRLAPESDRAWAAWGATALELARLGPPADQAARFERAIDVLTAARVRNPFDWLNARNLASAHRVWAAVDRPGRLAHLAAADRLFQEAAVLAPTNPRVWAEWGNVDAERGALHDAFVKLDRAATLYGEESARTVASAILRATGVDLNDPTSVARAAAELDRQGFHALASLYAARAETPR
jgi:tetratricopeptide (TPR) repeat protein